MDKNPLINTVVKKNFFLQKENLKSLPVNKTII